MMNANAYLYGNKIKPEEQRILSEDGFDDAMINYIYENENQKKSRAHRTSFLKGLFTRSGRKSPAYQG